MSFHSGIELIVMRRGIVSPNHGPTETSEINQLYSHMALGVPADVFVTSKLAIFHFMSACLPFIAQRCSICSICGLFIFRI